MSDSKSMVKVNVTKHFAFRRKGTGVTIMVRPGGDQPKSYPRDACQAAVKAGCASYAEKTGSKKT